MYSSTSFDKYIISYIHHYNIKQSRLTTLKISCAPPFHPSPLYSRQQLIPDRSLIGARNYSQLWKTRCLRLGCPETDSEMKILSHYLLGSFPGNTGSRWRRGTGRGRRPCKGAVPSRVPHGQAWLSPRELWRQLAGGTGAFTLLHTSVILKRLPLRCLGVGERRIFPGTAGSPWA